MEEVDRLKSPQLVEAALLWTGWGRSAWPIRDESSVVQRFGPEIAAQLLSTLKYLENEFYTSDARLVAGNLQKMDDMSAEQFRKNHPEVPREIVKAFAWCYTFDFK
jgi:hypothetical protein